MSATDSLRLHPSSENYSFTPSGPKLLAIDVNPKPELGNLGSGNSEAIYENVEHEYDMNSPGQPQYGYNGQIEMTNIDGGKTLELTKLSTEDNNDMDEILECVVNQPSVKEHAPDNDGNAELELNKDIESMKSDNSEALYKNNHPHSLGVVIGDTLTGNI